MIYKAFLDERPPIGELVEIKLYDDLILFGKFEKYLFDDVWEIDDARTDTKFSFIVVSKLTDYWRPLTMEELKNVKPEKFEHPSYSIKDLESFIGYPVGTELPKNKFSDFFDIIDYGFIDDNELLGVVTFEQKKYFKNKNIFYSKELDYCPEILIEIDRNRIIKCIFLNINFDFENKLQWKLNIQ